MHSKQRLAVWYFAVICPVPSCPQQAALSKLQMQQDEIDASLRDLWAERAQLNEQGWTELYCLVVAVLRGCAAGLVDSLPESEEQCVHDFFLDKVFFTAGRTDPLHHAGALRLYFRRWLLDQRDRADAARVTRGGLGIMDTDPGPLAVARQSKALAQYREQGDLADADLLGESELPLEPAERDALRALNLDPDELSEQARLFLRARSPWTELKSHRRWIALYLCCHFCPHDEDAVPLSRLQRRHNIPSYDYRARQLGVTFSREQAVALAQFRASHLGRWLEHLGIPISVEHRVAAAAALKILCWHAVQDKADC